MPFPYYGVNLSAKLPEAAAELFFFKNAEKLIVSSSGYSGEGKAFHAKKAAHLIWGKEFDMHEWADAQIDLFCDYQWATVTGPAAGGKTTAAAIYALEFFMADPMNTAVIVCSSTVPGLRRRIWKEIKRFYAKAQHLMPEANLVESKLAIQATKNDDAHGIFGIAVAQGQTDKALGRIIGFHPKRLLIVIDEMTDTPEAIVEACVNLSKTEGEFQLIGIGNAKSIFDAHGKMCEPKAGWASINVEHEFWETNKGGCLHLDGLKSPNIKAGKNKYPYLLKSSDIDQDKKFYGENSPKFWRFVRGFWAPQGLEDTVISEPMVIRFGVKRPATWISGYTMVAGLDVGYGGDRCALKIGRYGSANNGRTVIELIETVFLQLDTGSSEPLHFQIARQAREICKQRGVRPENFGLDATGTGSGTADILLREWSPRIQRVEFYGKPSERPVSNINPRTCREEYYNFVTELWFSVRGFMECDQIRGLADEDSIEFCSRLYERRGEKIMVEPKEQMKGRIGRSPDIADSVAVLVEVCRRNGVEIDAEASIRSGDAAEFRRREDEEAAIRRRYDIDSRDDCYTLENWVA